MFATCPHCQFLVAQHPQTRALPPTCPRCGRTLENGSPAGTTPSLVTYLQPVETMDTASTPDDAPAAPGIGTTSGRRMTPAIDEAAAHEPEAPHQADALPEADEPAHPGPADTATPIEMTAPPDAGPAREADSVLAAPADAASLAAAAKRATTRPTPRFTQAARTTPVHARAARWQWGVLAGLLLLLCMQVVLADRDRLAAQAGWRPVVMALCGVFGCDVPTWREPAAFAMLSREVRPVQGAPGQLQAQATFRNDARWTQAWPVILLTLKDADGRTLGARALQPQDYLAGAAPQDGIAPGQSAQVAILVREPSANVVAFSFDFR